MRQEIQARFAHIRNSASRRWTRQEWLLNPAAHRVASPGAPTDRTGLPLATVDRALSILRLFTEETPEWTVEAAARELGASQSTAYQYFRSLVDAGLLSTYRTGLYVIGPAIIELDRQTRHRDPLIRAAQKEMDKLSASLSDDDDVVLLCRLYKLTVMCVDQRAPVVPRHAVSYERGRPMPLDRGAASKVILAHLPPRVVRRYFDQQHPEAAEEAWVLFRHSLRAIRRAGVSVTHGELDAGRVGISAPVFGSEGDVVGSIGLVLSEESLVDGTVDPQVSERIIAAAASVSAQLGLAK